MCMKNHKGDTSGSKVLEQVGENFKKGDNGDGSPLHVKVHLHDKEEQEGSLGKDVKELRLLGGNPCFIRFYLFITLFSCIISLHSSLSCMYFDCWIALCALC